MSLDGFQVSAGVILLYTVARTLIAIALSVRSHRRGDPGSGIALQVLADGILAMGAFLYAQGATLADVPRTLPATLFVYAITWEAYGGVSRVESETAPGGVNDVLIVDDLFNFIKGFAWLFTTGMMILFTGAVAISRPEMTDSQRFSWVFGGGVPIMLGLMVRGYVASREHEGWSAADSIACVWATGLFAFAVWCWL
jgi:hypothetical protein